MALDPLTEGKKLSFLNPRKISGIFIGSDIISFLIQAGGSSLTASNNDSTVKIGLDAILAGMALNLASFTLFISIVVYFDVKTRKAYAGTSRQRRYYPVVCAIYVSWVFIMV
jgi:RTA1 like protein